MIFFFFLNYLFIWLHWVLVAASGIFIRSLVAARALLLCGMWDLNSLTKDWTPIPYITGQILNQWTSREVPEMIFFFFFNSPSVFTGSWASPLALAQVFPFVGPTHWVIWARWYSYLRDWWKNDWATLPFYYRKIGS